MDRISIPIKPVSSDGTVEDRSCRKCHFSWILQPSSKDVKNGIVEGAMYCCEPRAHVKMTDGVYPQLAQMVRESKKACGPRGLWWELAKEVPSGAITTGPASGFQRQPRRDQAYKVERPQSQFGRKTRETRESRQTDHTPPSSRKPYKVA